MPGAPLRSPGREGQEEQDTFRTSGQKAAALRVQESLGQCGAVLQTGAGVVLAPGFLGKPWLTASPGTTVRLPSPLRHNSRICKHWCPPRAGSEGAASNSSKGGRETVAPHLCHPPSCAAPRPVADGASLVTSWLGAASGPPLAGDSAERGSVGGPVPAAPRRGSALCSSALGEVCWGASASPGRRRDPAGHPGGTRRGAGRGGRTPQSH